MAVFQEQEYNKPFDFKVWKKMLPFLRPYYVNLCIVIVLNIVMALIDISMPLFQRYTIDHYIGGGTLEGIGWFKHCSTQPPLCFKPWWSSFLPASPCLLK